MNATKVPLSTTVPLSHLICKAKTVRAGQGAYPILSMTMRDGLIDQSSKFKKRVASEDTAQYKLVSKGQLVVGFPIDEGVLAIQGLYPKAVVSPAYDVWDLHADRICSDYLGRFLRSPVALAFYARKLRGSTARRRSLPDDVFLSLKVPVPPREGQDRLVDLLDTAEKLRVQHRNALREWENLIQATFLQMFGDPAEAMKDGRCEPLEAVVAPDRIVTYGIVQAGPEVKNGVPYIKTGDLKNGEILVQQLAKTSPDIAASYARSALRACDIVMSIRATVGTTALVPPQLAGANLTQGTARISPGPRTHPEYLLWYLRAPSVQFWIQSQVKGATFREITLGRLRQLPVLVPPLSAQQRYVDVLRRVANLRERSSDALEQCSLLFASLQHLAFSGEL